MSMVSSPTETHSRCFGKYKPRSITAVTKHYVWLIFDTGKLLESALKDTKKDCYDRISKESQFGGAVHSDAYKANIVEQRKAKKLAAAVGDADDELSLVLCLDSTWC
ncbi:hypothetical protein F503_07280 [Ophiostoma piceae UAMH 11346]|uniref:Uncharacterized protein n=1 Tax=Ophiostoma piceae (strain UAMH 11346) TaxID=1262450 RepID=S3C7J8_OPHP1|nr:hypothetical protein F503_07280 [Ophiostoma piceae UAMH 11346]